MQRGGSLISRIVLICALSIALNLLFMSSAAATSLFSENFGTGIDFTNDVPGWGKSSLTTSGRDDQLSRTGGSDANYYAFITQDTTDQYINKTGISTAGQQNIKITYYYNMQRSGVSNDFLVSQWKLASGNVWNDLQKVSASPGWNFASFDLPGAENTAIDIRFLEDGLDSLETILIDQINITGSLIANCGNGVLNNGEHCDDGNQNNNDGCINICTLTFCGDSIVQQPNGAGSGGPQDDGIEACDDGNLVNDDTCDNNCESTSLGICGDNSVDAGEQCDDGGTADGDGCDSLCQIEPFCGDGNIDVGEQFS